MQIEFLCSNCGKSHMTRPMVGIPHGMFSLGYRVVNLLSFALEIAHLAIDLPDDDDCISAEVVLRKLNRIGIVRKEEDSWVYDREKVIGE